MVTLVRVPQAAPEHPAPERDQVTPLFCESFCTEAVKLPPVETCKEVDVGLTETEMGRGATVKLAPLVATPPTVTTTFPVVAPAGTGAMMLVALQFVGAAVAPLNLTVLVPCVAPKFAPVITTDDPTAPEVGLKLVMLGVEVPPPGLVVSADWTTPAHPAKVMLTTARMQNTATHQRVFCEFAAERIVMNILFFPAMLTAAPKLRSCACPLQSRLLLGTPEGNWTQGAKRFRSSEQGPTVPTAIASQRRFQCIGSPVIETEFTLSALN